MKVSVLGCGNVGIAIAADLSINGHSVNLVKTSTTSSETYEKIRDYDNFIFIKENGVVAQATIDNISSDLSSISDSDIVIITVQSIYHEGLIERISEFINEDMIVLCICSYMSSFFFKKYCNAMPIVAESTGPYLEGRTEFEEDKIVFRVGCRLSVSPISVFQQDKSEFCLHQLAKLNNGFRAEYNTIESAILNPNMVLHTVGSLMSIPRIEYSKGNFCMYREAYARGNSSTMNIMLQLDAEKKAVLWSLGCNPLDILTASGFTKDKKESFYCYAESSDRAISPTSVSSRYITEDVSQGLVLMESIAKLVGIETPITTSLINIANASLKCDFRAIGRTVQKLGAKDYVLKHVIRYGC